ncbi:hypothetical protein FH972_024048 [Carpinus fangiana]|uniref:Uncharacterized protein n=1 Tax=Carpinus fangiana TaxID=176857 RepID=A0A5N6KX99_9ROSI|nr:hypothetical protein FH972_024048 [Carpinus fangiana]
MRRDDFTVGWVCALPLELTASRAMLDDEYDQLDDKLDPQDDNTYIWGRIGDHQVVMACPSADRGSDKPNATAGKDMLRSFPSVRFGLMVGIGVGMPVGDHDIRLGDVVVNKPNERLGGVVEYNLDKVEPDGTFEMRSLLHKPPLPLQHAIRDVSLKEFQLETNVDRIVLKFPQIAENYSKPGTNKSLTGCVHDDSECQDHEPRNRYVQGRKDNQKSTVHYGLITVGNRAIADTEECDRINKNVSSICFDVEAAGLRDSFPCLLVRGIFKHTGTDHCDEWREYAAATAAAFGRELLGTISAPEVVKTCRAKDRLPPRDLLSGPITLSEAKAQDTNILHELDYDGQRNTFFNHLHKSRSQMNAIVAHHLSLKPGQCQVSNWRQWIHGSFNVCIPIMLNSHNQARALLRFPLPYRIGEDFRPGNADEKLRCEAGTYAWLQQSCPSIPIPRLYGFGLSTGQMFTSLENLPFFSRCFQYLHQKILAWLGRPLSSHYIHHQLPGTALNELHTGYLLLEYVEPTEGQMLSNTWKSTCNDERRRTNLYRGLSQILLALAKVPLPRIGAFRLDDEGRLNLANRPLSNSFMMLENDQIPLNIPRDMTYETADTYLLDVLSTHDARIIHQLNGAVSESDFVYQTSTISSARASFFQIVQQDLRTGPFILSLTDLHQSNIFVDDDWHITKIIDLEFAYSSPIQSIQPPYWLVAESVDTVNEDDFNLEREKFMRILVEEEMHSNPANGFLLSSLMEQGWKSGAFWVYFAAKSISGFCRIFWEHILPRLEVSVEDRLDRKKYLHKLWRPHSQSILVAKMKDKDEYDRRLNEAFEDKSASTLF